MQVVGRLPSVCWSAVHVNHCPNLPDDEASLLPLSKIALLVDGMLWKKTVEKIVVEGKCYYCDWKSEYHHPPHYF